MTPAAPDGLEPPLTGPVRQGSLKPQPVAAAAAASLVTTDLSGSLNAADLAQALAGEGITISNVSYTGADSAAGTFTGGAGVLGFDEGIILSTGRISDVVGPNQTDDVTIINDTPGDADLDALIDPSLQTQDAAVLEFDFVPDSDSIAFEYVFSSDEYNEFVNSIFNDVFAFFVNGENCAVVGDPPVPVSINTINEGNPEFPTDPDLNPISNPQLYRNNDLDDGGGSIDSEMDGLTVVLLCLAEVNPGVTNTLKLAIADVSDGQLDSNVFIKAASLTTEVPGQISLSPATATNPVGTEHTVTATIRDSENNPIVGEEITFDVIFGPNEGEGTAGTSNSLGQAVFTYTGDGGAGTDTIAASFTDPATDEVLTTKVVKIWESDEPVNQPPTAEITSPADDATFTEGDNIDFAGSGTDPEDGDLTGDALVWTSDLDGEIGTGASFSLSTLSVGTHTITLTATDSEGATGTDQVEITVVEEPPPPPEEEEIEIDVIPGVVPNELDLAGGLLLVGILGSSDFDPSEVDLASIRLGDGEGPDVQIPNENEEEFVVELRDLNNDGITDLLLGYCIPDLVESGDLTESSTELVLRAQLTDGTRIRGTDAVMVVNTQP